MADANEIFEALKKGDFAKVKTLLAAHPALATHITQIQAIWQMWDGI